MDIEIVNSPRPLDQYDSADNHALYGTGEPPPKPPTLFELVADYMRELDENEGEATLKLDSLDEAIDQKAMAYKHIAVMLDAKERALRAEAGPWLELANKFIAKADSIKAEALDLEMRLLEAMKLTDKTTIITAFGNIRIAQSDSVELPANWVETADDQYVKLSREPRKAVIASQFRDNIKRLTAQGMTLAAARAEAIAALPAGVNIKVTESLQGLVKKS